MRLITGSMALFLLTLIAERGNILYSSLTLLPYKYETVKDAIQKLKRAEYLVAIHTTPGKALYATRAGKQALIAKLGEDNFPDGFPPVEYDARKAYRKGLLSETELFFEQAGFDTGSTLHSYPSIRRVLEEQAPGAADFIKYARFSAFWERDERGGTLIYNFGHKNRIIKKNGEKNAEQAVKELFAPTEPYIHGGIQYSRKKEYFISRIILGEHIKVLEDIVRFSVRFEKMPKSQQAYINRGNRAFLVNSHDELNFHFLPVSREVLPALRMFKNQEIMNFLERMISTYSSDYAVTRLFDYRIDAWVHLLTGQTPSKPRLIFCFDWQESLVHDLLSDMARKEDILVLPIESENLEACYLANNGEELIRTDAYRLET